jgi:hypothetical protein
VGGLEGKAGARGDADGEQLMGCWACPTRPVNIRGILTGRDGHSQCSLHDYVLPLVRAAHLQRIVFQQRVSSLAWSTGNCFYVRELLLC